jgi:P27 family predicted phage terminase small subunit
MGARGPKPLPSNIHLLQGNASKKPLAQLLNGIRPDVHLPDPPAHLDAVATAEWHRFGGELLKLRIVSALDMAALEIYCANYSVWVFTCGKIKERQEESLVDITPSGYKQMGVWFQIRNRAADAMKSAAAEFGATPSARTRVSPGNAQEDLFGFDAPNIADAKKSKGRFFK